MKNVITCFMLGYLRAQVHYRTACSQQKQGRQSFNATITDYVLNTPGDWTVNQTVLTGPTKVKTLKHSELMKIYIDFVFIIIENKCFKNCNVRPQ